MTLRTKLLVWYSGVFFLTASGLVLSMYAVIAHKIRGDFLHHLSDEYDEAVRITTEHIGSPDDLSTSVRIEVRENNYFPMSYRLYDADQGTEVLAVTPEWGRALPPRPEWEAGSAAPVLSLRKVGERASRLVYLLTGTLHHVGRPDMVLEVGISYKRIYKRLHTLREVLVGCLIVSVIVSAAGGRFLAARSLDPIGEMTQALKMIQAGDLSRRLDEREGKDELAQLTAAINSLLARLERSFEDMRTFTSDAAHELRTPLAGLRCMLEVPPVDESADERLRADLLLKVDELTRLVNDMLLLARLDAESYTEEAARLDLGPILGDVGEAFGVLAEEKGIGFAVTVQGELAVEGRPSLLRRLLGNLVENAIEHTPSGGKVAVTAERAGNVCRVSVEDTGIGLGPRDIDRVFDRFYRADESRSRTGGGLGLGLSICKRVAELHGGSITVESREGEGSRFTVTLPTAVDR